MEYVEALLPVPAKPSWLLRIQQIVEQLIALDVPVVDRATCGTDGYTLVSHRPKATKLFADGSYIPDAGVGAWAFYIPAFQIRGCEASPGTSAEQFEFIAVIQGLQELVRRHIARARVLPIRSLFD